MAEETQVVKVSIFGSEYPIRAGLSDEDYIREVAAFVDARMHEIQGAMKPSSTLKVAILAALNIADELLSTQVDRERLLSSHHEKITSLSDRLDDLLSQS
ncbi:cell division protein ZapA [bacterium BMS3Bbin04]|nr:cell division protein ZapA [bacterium BMS3Bbin04]